MNKTILFSTIGVVILALLVIAHLYTKKDDQGATNQDNNQLTNNIETMDTLEQGQVFLAENSTKDGVTTTETGLQYSVLTKGTGQENPTAADAVKVHYHGTTIDGTVFDSSVDRGEPISFPLNRVISGWTEGLQLMAIGDKYRFFIPSELAYGPQSPSAKIPANSVLIFDVELLGINE